MCQFNMARLRFRLKMQNSLKKSSPKNSCFKSIEANANTIGDLSINALFFS